MARNESIIACVYASPVCLSVLRKHLAWRHTHAARVYCAKRKQSARLACMRVPIGNQGPQWQRHASSRICAVAVAAATLAHSVGLSVRWLCVVGHR